MLTFRPQTEKNSKGALNPPEQSALLLILLVVGSLLWFGWLEWPGLHWDADLFCSALMNVALKNEWSFNSYSQFLITKPTNAYDFHGVLQIWFYAKLLHVRSWQQLSIAMAVVNILTFLIWLLLYQNACWRRGRRLPWLQASLMALVPAVIVLGLQGRPEQLAPLLLAVPAMTRELGWHSVMRRSVDGITLGTLFLLSPLVGLMGCMGYSFWVAAERQFPWNKRAEMLAPVLLLTFVVSALGVSMISPIGFLTWLQNLRAGGSTVPFSWVIPNAKAWRWGTTLLAPFWSMVLAAAVLSALARWLRNRQLIVVAAAIAALIWVSQRGLDYSYTPFLPMILLLWIDQRLLVPKQPRLRYLGLKLLPLIFALAYGLMFGQQLFYSFIVLREGGTPAQARLMINAFRDPGIPAGQQTLATSMAQGRAGLVLASAETPTIGLPWSASNESEPWPFWSLNRFEQKDERDVKLFVLQQSHNVIYTPPPSMIYLDDNQPFVLVKDGWKRQFSFLERRLIPARLGNGFWLAVYKRGNSLPQQSARSHEGKPG